MADKSCDFCNVPVAAPIELPCEEFDVADESGHVIYHSRGTWLVCKECAALVDLADRAMLVARTAAGSYRSSQEPLTMGLLSVAASLVDGYFAHRL